MDDLLIELLKTEALLLDHRALFLVIQPFALLIGWIIAPEVFKSLGLRR